MVLVAGPLSRRFRCSAHYLPCGTAKKYTEDHEAVVFDDSTGIGTVSITDYAQSSLGDVVFVELPAVKTKVTRGGQQLPLSLRARWTLIFFVILPSKPFFASLP